MIANGTRIQFKLEPPNGQWHGAYPALQLGTIRDSYKSGSQEVYDIELDVELAGGYGTRVTCGPDTFVIAKPARVEVQPARTAECSVESGSKPRPYDAALRIIADLHAAYGPDAEISYTRNETTDAVTLHHNGGGWLDLTVEFNTEGGITGSQPGKLGNILDVSPQSYMVGVEEARVWLHRYGRKH